MFQISPVYARPQSAVPAALVQRRQTRVRTSVEKLAPRMGDRILGVIDPGCLGSSQIDGRTMMEVYGKLGLHLGPAENAVDARMTEVWSLLVSGRLKVMASLTNWFREFRKYHRDDQGSGKIVKRDNHLMDATRYLIISGRPTHAFQAPPDLHPGLLMAVRYGCEGPA